MEAGLGLALGGGGITGCSHVGVICALEEAGIPIVCMAGTSAGAMVSALYAAGFSGRQLADLVPKLTRKLLDYDYRAFLMQLILPKRPFPGMIRGKRLHDFMYKHIGELRLADLQFPLAITAADLQKARKVLFTSTHLNLPYAGPETEIILEARVLDAVLASMAIPGLFRPIRLGGRLLVDGGLMDNCPSASLKAMGASRILAINLVSVQPVIHPLKKFSSIVSRSLSLGLHRLSGSDSAYADLVLNPDVGHIGVLDFEQIPACVEKGYACAMARMDEIKRLAEGKPPADEAIPAAPDSYEAYGIHIEY